MSTPTPTPITILDGPLGTELLRRAPPPPDAAADPLWSARYLTTHPGLITELHREYAQAGATVHTTNTFRTTRRAAGDTWRHLLDLAVTLARNAVPPHHKIAGAIAPLEDCYRPDLSPLDPRPEHRETARALAEAGSGGGGGGGGVDIILCETFPHLGEALIATEEALATGLPTWVAFTAGPSADLLTPAQVAEGARRAITLGASAVLINCTPVTRTTPHVEALAQAVAAASPSRPVHFGAYANAGSTPDGYGWHADPALSATRYADAAHEWIDLGATIIGSCCGTTPAHTAELARRFARP